jgi:hypothetical protein
MATIDQLRKVLGPDFQTPEIFNQRGLTSKGVDAAVRVTDAPGEFKHDVVLVGPGGFPIGKRATDAQLANFGIASGTDGASQFQSLFGQLSQEGIVREINMAQAKQLGITFDQPSATNTRTNNNPQATATDQGSDPVIVNTNQGGS